MIQYPRPSLFESKGTILGFGFAMSEDERKRYENHLRKFRREQFWDDIDWKLIFLVANVIITALVLLKLSN